MHPKHLLERHGLEPKKSLGQNFLFDEQILSRIVAAAEVVETDHVLEIGPGLGSLTQVLAETAASVTAVELDSRFLPILQEQLQPYNNVTLVHGDILEQNPADWFDGPYKVVANVPYYITGAILRHLLSAPPRPSVMVLTVQKEVAERVTAVPPHMSLLAVSVQYYGQVQIVDTIKAGAFWPRPDVDSAVIHLEIKNGTQMNADDTDLFFRIVKAGFSQKRKQLQKNLRQLEYDQGKIADILEQAGINGRRRAETLNLDEWHQLMRAYHASS
ncbi:MAG: ribosomal RNA small subunit methyltransferase A [Ardenticatenaceae bacterium]|nr:ribosomal RNA small subunit methyltransferase A [Ardenticatenaceae bacterium]MCB9444472.1 ribosomal RNA small subunit methyltransferase A [Ardenticatenaceae bacterium]